ncbi:hypothetical protein BT69DRAFT_1328342 [Atractiella rhizophila]|nr:hypothetical protein BT69DRAFT_1328342 [Atractiella rhizophila]
MVWQYLSRYPFPNAANEVDATSGSESSRTYYTILGVASPLVLLFLVSATAKQMEIETFFEFLIFNLRLSNLFSFIVVPAVALSWKGIVGYSVWWMATSFFFPQPPYLGPTKAKYISATQLQEDIAFSPASLSTNDMASLSEQEIRSRLSAHKQRIESKLSSSLGKKNVLVLFHADWSAASREVEIRLHRLSLDYTSPSLSFAVLSVTEAPPAIIYDYDVSPEPRERGVPTLILFKGGKEVARLPKQSEKRKKGASRIEEMESDEEMEDETEQEKMEREVKEEWGRWRWDRSAQSIRDQFGLEEKREQWRNWEETRVKENKWEKKLDEL